MNFSILFLALEIKISKNIKITTQILARNKVIYYTVEHYIL